jgi:uncharacterized OB-fold protein
MEQTEQPAVEYPQPTRSAANAPLLDAWQRGELVIQHCEDCDAQVFFPREMCPVCWSTRLAWRESAGIGKVVSYTIVHRHIHPAFAGEVPTVFAEIALDDSASMLARIVTDKLDKVASGMRVELLPLPDAARYPLPTFRPMSNAVSTPAPAPLSSAATRVAGAQPAGAQSG